MKRLHLLLLPLLLALILTNTVGSAYAAPLPDDDCEPFDEHGNAEPSKDCACSENPNDDQYCMSGTDYLIYNIVSRVQMAQLSLMETGAQWYWLLARVLEKVAAALMSDEAWRVIRDTLMTSLVEVMGGEGGVLYQMVGGTNGLFGIALLLAGLILCMPVMAEARLVKIERVMIWGAFLLGLFVFSASGFDLIESIESLRISLMETAAGTGEQDALSGLIAKPMLATTEEAQSFFEEELLVLPAEFRTQYFPGIEPCEDPSDEIECGDYRRIRVLAASAFMDALEFIFATQVIQTDVLEERQEQAGQGLIRVCFSVYITYVLLLFAVNFALLAAVSLLLVIFFVVALPLGFFEFGGEILTSLIRQYTGVVAWSLFVSVFLRLVLATFDSVLGQDFTLTGILASLAVVTVVLLVLQMSLRQVWSLMDGTLGLVQQSVRSVGGMAVSSDNGPISEALHSASGAMSTAVTAVAAAGAGAVTGGVGAALVAGAGGMLQGTRTGSTAATLATAVSPESEKTQLFASMVHGMPAMGVVAQSRARREQAEGGMQYGSQPLNPTWGAVEQDEYLTTDLGALANAETAYFQQRQPVQARRELERAFGSSRTAEQALGAYQARGLAGARQVRQTVEITQETAAEWQGQERPVFDESGAGLAPEFHGVLRQRLRGLYGQDAQQAVLVGSLSAAALRRPGSVWEDPQAAEKLAHDTLDPEGLEVQVDDLAAQHRLRSLALRQGWGEAELAALFAPLPTLEPGESSMEEALFLQAQEQPIFAHTGESTLREAARLTVLVGAQAQIQRPAQGEMDWSAPEEMMQETEPIAAPSVSIAPIKAGGMSGQPPAPAHADLPQVEASQPQYSFFEPTPAAQPEAPEPAQSLEVSVEPSSITPPLSPASSSPAEPTTVEVQPLVHAPSPPLAPAYTHAEAPIMADVHPEPPDLSGMVQSAPEPVHFTPEQPPSAAPIEPAPLEQPTGLPASSHPVSSSPEPPASPLSPSPSLPLPPSPTPQKTGRKKKTDAQP